MVQRGSGYRRKFRRRHFDARWILRTGSGAADLLRAIENAPAILQGKLPVDRLGVRAMDDWTLEIRLSHPVPYFPDILTNTVASPVHPSSLERSGGFSRPGSTVSNGPYSLSAFAPGANLVLKRNSRYWDSAAVAFDEIRYEFVPDENAEYTRFSSGEIDVTYSVPEQRFQELLGKRDPRLQHRSTLATIYFTLNTDRGPLSGKPGLREALSLAVDRERDHRFGDARRPGARVFARAGRRVELRAGRLRVARRIRGRALEREPASCIGRRAIQRTVRFACGSCTTRTSWSSGSASRSPRCGRKCWASKPSSCRWSSRPTSPRGRIPAQWDVVRVGWTADYNDASTFLDTMTRDSPQNFGRWSNAEYARLLGLAAGETDASRRRDMLQQAESLMLNDYPLLPVYYYVTRRLVQPRIAAPAINPMNRTYSRYFRLAR